jgi:hypothetical protein
MIASAIVSRLLTRFAASRNKTALALITSKVSVENED